jgi:uncharacterized oligopeptide transporter (OPT) family protein
MATFRNLLTLIGAALLPLLLLRSICAVALFEAWRHAGASFSSDIAHAAFVFTGFLSAAVAGVIAGLVLQVARPRAWGWLLAVVVFLEGGSLITVGFWYGSLADALLAAASALLASLSYFATRARKTRNRKELSAR